jgi:hypothetical protein
MTNVNLSESLDWLFNKATLDLSRYILHSQERVIKKAKQQMLPFADKSFPAPGEDPELIHIVNDVLSPFFSGSPPDDAWRQLVQRVRQHVALENKRKNLVGEGFEDVLAITQYILSVNDVETRPAATPSELDKRTIKGH